jgi:hypothetical protein
MPRPTLIERYFAQCQAHRSPPLPTIVAGLNEGVLEINLADLSLADVRLFALAVTDTTTMTTSTNAAAAPVLARERRREESAGATPGGGTSSASSAHGHAVTFSKLHFTYDPSSSSRRQQQQQQQRHANTGRGAGRGGPTSSAPAAPPPLLAPQSEATLRCVIEAVTLLVKDNATTLKSFAWCGLPVVAPSRGPRGGASGARMNVLSLTQLLPLCRHLKCLRFEGVALSRAQFMQLTMISLSSSTADMYGGSWLELEEASFVNCDLTDACKGGIVRLLRAALPMKTAELLRRSLRSMCGSSDDRGLAQPPPTSTRMGGTSAMRGLRRLDLSENPLGDDTARAVATAIVGSALHTLCLANTSITGKGAAMLLLPSVLEENGIELIDLSDTQVSDAYGTSGAGATSSAAELRLLAASSISAGFRVVARGMGQLLILREAVRLEQQPWNVRTSSMTGAAAVPPPPQLPHQPPQLSPVITSPITASPPAVGRMSPSVMRQPSRGRGISEEAEDGPVTPDPFNAFIQTTPSPLVAAPASPAHAAPFLGRQQPVQQQRPFQHAGTAGTTAAAFVVTQPDQTVSPTLPPPPLPAAPGSSYGPWWPAMASWHAMRYPFYGGAEGVTGTPKPGEHWEPIPVLVPVPFLAPMALPYGTTLPGGVPWAGAAPPPAAAGPPTSTNTTAAAASATAEGESTGVNRGAASHLFEKRKGTFASTERGSGGGGAPLATESLLLHDSTGAVGDEAAEGGHHPPHAATAQETEEWEAISNEVVRVAPAGPTTTFPSVGDDVSSSGAATDLTREASEAAGGSKFLSALISRLEAHETDVSERLEQQYQRTTSQITAMERDVRFRLQQLAEAERKERITAAERQAALLEAITALREASSPSSDADTMSADMLSQLVVLIKVGMQRVHAVLEKGGSEKAVDKKPAVKDPAPLSTGAATATAPAATERDMVKEASQRLKELGW